MRLYENEKEIITSTTIWLDMVNIKSRIAHYYLLEQIKGYETRDTVNNVSLFFNKKLFKREVPADRVTSKVSIAINELNPTKQNLSSFYQRIRQTKDILSVEAIDLKSDTSRLIDVYFAEKLAQSNVLQRQKINFLLDGIK